MFTLLWNLSAALRGYLRFYAPTNLAAEWMKSPRGLKWAIPVVLIATPSYLLAMSVCVTLVERGSSGALNLLVLLFAWNALKLAIVGVLTPVRWLTRAPSTAALRRVSSKTTTSGVCAGQGPEEEWHAIRAT
jgi:hypothetical protein